MKKERKKTASNKKMYGIVTLFFWLFAWQVLAILVNNQIFLASPRSVLKALIELAGQKLFWLSIFNSFFKILIGLILAILIGIFIAVLSYNSCILKELIVPFMRGVQATPVASFIILALLWIRSENLSILCSFLMVLPVIYTNVLQGLINTDIKLLEMARVFRIKSGKKIRYIYIPAVMPYFASACSIGLGLCWKAGIAAEVIGLPKNSIGEQLYESKIYLMTDQLFAWTIVIISVSVISEKVLLRLIRFLQRKWAG